LFFFCFFLFFYRMSLVIFVNPDLVI
jgi:hypothetical protein